MMSAPSSKQTMVIAGAGPAGLSAGLWAARLGLRAMVLEAADEPGGQLRSYSLPVVDLPGFESDPAPALIATLTKQVAEVGIPVYLRSRAVRWNGAALTVEALSDPIKADWFFYAPGLRARVLGIPGEEWASQESISDAVRSPSGSVLIIGAGDRAVEGAFRLAEAGHQVTLLCRSDRLKARRAYRMRLRESGVTVKYHTRLVHLAASGKRRHAWLEGPQGAQEWEGDRVMIRIGMEPRVDPNLASVRGDLAYPRALRMSIIGDAALAVPDRSLVTAMASAMRAVKAVAVNLGEA
ncbi:NAD(P)/FAD-dependent oxidoreductase [Sulfobacillus harzensis]|nr:NAD(P)/FAD-dependent oxidoreductase [Sulfobacillus harzensis]